MAKALLVLPDKEQSVNQYRRMRRLLEQQGLEVQVAAPRRGEIVLAEDLRLTPDLELGRVNGGDYDLVVFIAGRGNRELWDLPEAHRIARDALAAGKVVGASGAAAGILANADLLHGHRATGPISLAGALQAKGAEYTAEPVAVDDGIVTLRKSEVFSSFGQILLELVRQRAEARKVA